MKVSKVGFAGRICCLCVRRVSGYSHVLFRESVSRSSVWKSIREGLSGDHLARHILILRLETVLGICSPL